MDKAILVIDSPSSCYDCPLRMVKFRHLCETIIIDSCNAINREIDKKHFYNMTKPDWCPLKKMPDKSLTGKSDYYQWGDWEDGWNACIDNLIDK